jgi:hypothetical protein
MLSSGKELEELNLVIYACNLSYLELEESQFEVSQGKKLMRHPSQPKARPSGTRL